MATTTAPGTGTTRAQVVGLSAVQVLDRVRAARDRAHQAEVEELELAVAWAHLHPCAADDLPAAWAYADGLFDESHAALAGPGTPEVAEFAPAALAAQLGISLTAGRHLIGDALELTYRLPRLWDHVLTGRVPVWRARQISRETHDLSLDAVGFADRLIAATPERIDQVDAARLVHEARLYYDPDRATADEDEALARRGVWLRTGGAPATTDVWMTLDTPDALLLRLHRGSDRRRPPRPRRQRPPRRPPRPRRRRPGRPPVRPGPHVRPRQRRPHPGTLRPRRRATSTSTSLPTTSTTSTTTSTERPAR